MQIEGATQTLQGEDVSSGRNENYTAKYPLIDIEQRS